MDYTELKVYQNRYVDPNKPIKRDTPAWLTKSRKLALFDIQVNLPSNCLQGHYLCPIAEHYYNYTQRFYTIGQEHNEPIVNEDIHTKPIDNGNVVLRDWNKYKTDADNNTLYIRVVESVKAIDTIPVVTKLDDYLIDKAVKYWGDDYRLEQLEQWHNERRELHKLNEKSFPLRGRFNNISSVIFHESQPLYYIHSMGIDAIHKLPFALIRLASSNDTIMVTLEDVNFKGLSRNAKRKMIKYSKPMSVSIREQIEQKARLAVKEYLGI
jgi:hypothetical protein